MIAFGISGILVGMALALRFKVFVLIPVLLMAAGSFFTASAFGVASVDRVFATFLWFVLGLQLGYLSMSAAPFVTRRSGLQVPTKA